MWRDFDYGDGATTLGGAPFSFPDPVTPNWRQLWQAIVGHVALTPDEQTKTELLDQFARRFGVRTLGFVNAHAMNQCVVDPAFAADILALGSVVRDGIGVQALYRLLGRRAGLNLNGTDLLPELISRFAGKRVAVFGTQLPLAERVGEKLRVELGCEPIAAHGFHADGYYVDLVARTRPALVILGMGMPKQERVARLMKQALHQDVAIVCGGAILDFLSGHITRAPLWMRRAGMEWVFRLGLEPRRLFRRYVMGNPIFLLRSAILALRGAGTGRPARRSLQMPAAARPVLPPHGIGGPLAATTLDRLATRPTNSAEIVTLPTPPVRPRRPQPSVFSANRPVVERDDLYGRGEDLARLQARVLDQRGSALIYGPRGYGKTSLVRVFGEVADSLGHVVIYASCSRGVGFDNLLRSYLTELAAEIGTPMPDAGTPLTVPSVAAILAAVGEHSVVFILDEFDRVDRDDTRESVVELIKDVSDLTGSVRFLLVGVATDSAHILGYHPSVHRCLSCVPLSRLSHDAIETLFRDKAGRDAIDIPAPMVSAIVALVAGSAYHAQLIGQKLAGGSRDAPVDAARFNAVLDEIVEDNARIDAGFARLRAEFGSPGPGRDALMRLADSALRDSEDLVRPGAMGDGRVAEFCAGLASIGVLEEAGPLAAGAYRFTNAFTPQLLTILAHRQAAAAA